MCRRDKENKNLKVVERFRVEREFAQGSLCIELEVAERCAGSCIYSNESTHGRTRDVLELELLIPI